jgi:hypothetical protein
MRRFFIHALAFFALSNLVSCVPDTNQEKDKAAVTSEPVEKLPDYATDYLKAKHSGFEVQEFTVNTDSSVQVDFYAEECRGALTFKKGVCVVSEIILAPEIMPSQLKSFIKQRHPDSLPGIYVVTKTTSSTVHSLEIPDGSYNYAYTFDAAFTKLTEQRFEANEEELNDVTGSGYIAPEDSLGE